MEWNGKWNGMKRKFWCGIWKMPEWNVMEDFKNGIEDNLPHFHTNSILDLQKNIYGCRVMINNIVTEVFHFNIFAYYLSTNRGTLVVFIEQTLYTK